MPTPGKLRIFRIQDGVRVPYTIELDSQLTVIAEYADTTTLEHVASGRRPRMQENPDRVKSNAVSKWASDSVKENPIPGTDDLREQFFEDRQKLLDLFARQGSKCPPCEHGKLIRSWREKLEKAGHLDSLA